MDQAVEIGAILKPGVYILRREDEIVFIGASKCMLHSIHAHRNAAIGPRLPEWFPIKGIRFDDIAIFPMSYDRAIPYAQALIDLHKPVHNIHSGPEPINPFIPPNPLPPITRRV